MTIRVLVADDHAVVRDGLSAVLQTDPDIRVAGAAATGLEAVAAFQRLRPDVVVMDIGMPGINGIDATRRICEHDADAAVLILSMHGDAEQVYRALKAGARGYLLKEAAGAEVVAAESFSR